MPQSRKDHRLLELARPAAELRFRDLLQELKYLVGLFPHLRDSFDPDELPLSFLIAKGAGRLKRVRAERPKRQMSAARRKEASERMKKYWAARKKAK